MDPFALTRPLYRTVKSYSDRLAADAGSLLTALEAHAVGRPQDRTAAITTAKHVDVSARRRSKDLFFRFEGIGFEPFVLSADEVRAEK